MSKSNRSRMSRYAGPAWVIAAVFADPFDVLRGLLIVVDSRAS